MQEVSSTNYTITGVDSVGNSFLFLQTTELDDSSCLSLISTLRGFAWPSAMAPVTIAALKSSDDTTTWQCGAGTNPPAFN